MMKQTSAPFQEALSLALQLPPVERLAMIEELAASFRQEFAQSNESEQESLTDQEIQALMQVEPLPSDEVVALGLLGKWAHLNITDGAAWINEQKRKRSEKRKWQTN